MHEQLYWLVHNGTLHIYRVADKLVNAGCCAEALPYILFAAKAQEMHLQLSNPEFLPWRCQLYAAAVHCYRAAATAGAQPAAAATAAALTFLQDGLAQLDKIIKVQALDPVPAPADVTAALQAAQAHLQLLKYAFEPAEGGRAEAAVHLRDLLPRLGDANAQLKVLLDVLMAGSIQQPLEQTVLPGHLQPLLEAAAQLAEPSLAVDAMSSPAQSCECALHHAVRETVMGVDHAALPHS